MKTKMNVIQGFSILIVLALLSSTTPARAQKDWVRLGTRKVNYTVDHDVIPVGLKDGVFTKLRVVVTGGSLNMYRMVVEYGNGTKDEIPLRHTFTRRSTSRVIDLRGNRRIIRKITFWYDTKGLSGRRATVTVFGRK